MNSDKDTIKYPISILGDLHDSDCEDCESIRNNMRDILHSVAIALKGPNAPLSLHSWHDLAEVAIELQAKYNTLQSYMMKQAGQYAEVVRKLDAALQELRELRGLT